MNLNYYDLVVEYISQFAQVYPWIWWSWWRYRSRTIRIIIPVCV